MKTSARSLLFLGQVVLLLIGFVGCATYPSDPQSQADWYVTRAREAILRSDAPAAVGDLRSALERPTGAEKARAMLASQPTAGPLLHRYLESWIEVVTTPDQANKVYDVIAQFSADSLITKTESIQLRNRLIQRVDEGNASGLIRYSFGDDRKRFPELQTPTGERYVLENSIALLQGKSSEQRRECIVGLMDYVSRKGTQSSEAARIRELLPSFHLTKSELELVRSTFAEYASLREQEVTLRVNFTLKGGDRLMRDDLEQAMVSQIKGLVFVPSERDAQLLLTIERVRHDERVGPERAQTITYAWTDVNMVAAVLLMPKYASYIYEQVSGSAEIDYGYVVQWIAGKNDRRESVVRGKVGGQYNRCQNQRVQNVYGGVTSADFVANDDMNRRCSGPREISMNELRTEVLTKILDAVKEIPQIKSVDQING